MKDKLEALLENKGFAVTDGVYCRVNERQKPDKTHRNSLVFGEKWEKFVGNQNIDQTESAKIARYYKLYGFSDEGNISDFLQDKSVILDAGAGYGFKSAHFASLSPKSTVISVDISNSIFVASKRYSGTENLLFVKEDIADMPFEDNSIDFINCDQVLHHTIKPSATLEEFVRLLKPGGYAALYVYARKALPRELLDEHFVGGHAKLSNEDLWELSRNLVELGRVLHDADVELDFPDIPQLGIVGGKQNLQRFIYYNFIKCFWNEEQGRDVSISTNFDWYAPSIAYRYSEEEFHELATTAGLECVYAYSEPASHSGLFIKRG